MALKRKSWVIRDGKLVEKHKAPPLTTNAHNFVRDITPFMTQDGVEISSRSKLRDYEARTGTRQVGNDWTGREKPVWWDQHIDRERKRA